MNESNDKRNGSVEQGWEETHEGYKDEARNKVAEKDGSLYYKGITFGSGSQIPDGAVLEDCTIIAQSTVGNGVSMVGTSFQYQQYQGYSTVGAGCKVSGGTWDWVNFSDTTLLADGVRQRANGGIEGGGVVDGLASGGEWGSDRGQRVLIGGREEFGWGEWSTIFSKVASMVALAVS